MSDRELNTGPRIEDEKQTVERMIRYYCKKKHDQDKELCSNCSELMTYSHQQLSRCRFGEEKPTCRKCPVHCFEPDMRQQIKTVMRYSGLRLVVRAPIVWIRHKIHDRK